MHFRDEEEAYKETIAHGLAFALSKGIYAVSDEPNPKRPVIDRHRVKERLALVPEKLMEHYFLYVGLTDDDEQIEEAVWCYRNIPKVVGLKLFAGKSVGPLSVTDVGKQKGIYKVLTDIGYDGPVQIHCEREDLIKHNAKGEQDWDPTRPITHAYARPADSEIAAVEDMFKFAMETGFKGHVHIAHASVPETVDIVTRAKKSGLRASCEVTPHHLLYSWDRMVGSGGLVYKMNPPLRSPIRVQGLRVRVAAGDVDCIGTDHAPHHITEKLFPPYLSGYPAIGDYPFLIYEFLPGIGTKEETIKAMTHDNPLRIFEKLQV